MDITLAKYYVLYYYNIWTYIYISFSIHIYEEGNRKYDDANDTKWKHSVNLGKEFFVFLKLNL